jgi:hypothetical protein
LLMKIEELDETLSLIGEESPPGVRVRRTHTL